MLGQLPDELIVAVGSHLGVRDLNRLARTCHRMYACLNQDLYRLDAQDAFEPIRNIAIAWSVTHDRPATAHKALMAGQKESSMKRALAIAAMDGHEAMARLLLSSGQIHVDTRISGKATALCRAAEHGHESLVRFLLSPEAAPPDEGNPLGGASIYEGRSPLIAAISKNHEAIACMILSRHKDNLAHDARRRNLLDMEDGDGATALSWAAFCGSEATVLGLLDLMPAADAVRTRDERVNHRDDWFRTPAMRAAKGGAASTARLLAAHGADMASADDAQRTVLSYACESGSADTIRAILDLLDHEGAVDLDAPDERGRTPFSWAAASGRRDAVQLLLDEAARRNTTLALDQRDLSNMTPLMHAARGGHTAVVDLLLDVGRGVIDLDVADNDRESTPLIWAANGSHKAVVRLLLDSPRRGYHLDVNAADHLRDTALLTAAFLSCEPIVRMLVAVEGIDLSNDVQPSPLHLAASRGDAGIVRLLLGAGADVNARSFHNWTALWMAASIGSEETVQVLLECEGIEISVVDEEKGLTPLGEAEEKGHTAIAEMIKKAELHAFWG